MFYKDRVLRGFRSLYAQRPTQRSVLRRTFFFNAEVAVYAYKGYVVGQDYSNLVQRGIDERIPWFSERSFSKHITNCLSNSFALHLQGENVTHFRSHC